MGFDLFKVQDFLEEGCPEISLETATECLAKDF